MTYRGETVVVPLARSGGQIEVATDLSGWKVKNRGHLEENAKDEESRGTKRTWPGLYISDRGENPISESGNAQRVQESIPLASSMQEYRGNHFVFIVHEFLMWCGENQKKIGEFARTFQSNHLIARRFSLPQPRHPFSSEHKLATSSDPCALIRYSAYPNTQKTVAHCAQVAVGQRNHHLPRRSQWLLQFHHRHRSKVRRNRSIPRNPSCQQFPFYRVRRNM